MKRCLDVLWRRKWIMISFFLVVVAIVTILTFMQKNVYRATATVVTDIDKPNYFAYKNYMETQQEIIKSRRTAYHVIKNLNLGTQKEFKETGDPIQALLKRLHVEPIRNTRVLRISVEDEDSEMASCIANEFAMVYVNPKLSHIQTNNARVQDLADTAQIPIKPKKELSIILSIIVGILGGTGLVFFREYIDGLKRPIDIALLSQLTVLGSVPGIRFNRDIMEKESDIYRIVKGDPYSLVSEAYRSIRANLLLSLNDSNNAKSIAITSSLPSEGRTLTAVNLAILMASGGEKVLLVDSDMRRPRIHRIFNDKNEAGFFQFLSGKSDFNDIVRTSGIDNLYFVASGKVNRKSSELILSKNTDIFIEKATRQFLKIIFDTAPIAVIRDMAVLSSKCTGVILMIEKDRVREALLNRSKELLEKANAKILGVIVNNSPALGKVR